MRMRIVLDMEDGTGEHAIDWGGLPGHSPTPDMFWYLTIRNIRMLLRNWLFKRDSDAGKPPAWRVATRKWEEPINQMIARAKDAVAREE